MSHNDIGLNPFPLQGMEVSWEAAGPCDHLCRPNVAGVMTSALQNLGNKASISVTETPPKKTSIIQQSWMPLDHQNPYATEIAMKDFCSFGNFDPAWKMPGPQ